MHNPCKKSAGRLGQLLVFASALAFGQGQVFAQATGTASVANFRYSVTDLNATDGIDAVVKLGASPGSPTASGNLYGWHTGVEEPDFYNGKYVTDNVNAGGTALSQGELAAFRSTYSGREALSTVRGEVMATAAPGLPGLNIKAWADVEPAELYFQLAPMSSMTVQIDVTMLLSAASVEGFAQYVRGGARLTVGPTWWPGYFDQVQDDVQGIAGQYWGTIYPGEVSLAQTLSVTLVNKSATAWKDGEISFAAGVTAEIASPVPEAQTWQLMAAGLVVLPVWARRRRARRVAQS
ncbi:hypothetical protein [Pseudoduganella armeniaca]|uniref:PEP-CTERM sorting domain-containing protein n=1 Tax=Pseudoduganella armeniaca TaxID=2072590 RepID=A0A2R4CFF9_9BURK|nr:hypothetical protein [Pseudoduganella armeniaca]AVR98381.1 hypothetical protein C9I28_24120 [Pseudoduganella armeniaca]